MLPLRHLLYSERDVLSAARLVFKTNKQNNGTTDISSQFRHHISVVVISVCLAFAVKIKWKEPTEIHPDRYNTLPFQLVLFFLSLPSREVLCELKQSYWVHTAVSLVCSSVFISLSISQIASRRLRSAVFFHTQDSPISKQTDVSILTLRAGSDVRRVCLHVDVSTLIQTPLFSSHLSAPDVVLVVKMDLCSWKKKVESNTFLCL